MQDSASAKFAKSGKLPNTPDLVAIFAYQTDASGTFFKNIGAIAQPETVWLPTG